MACGISFFESDNALEIQLGGECSGNDSGNQEHLKLTWPQRPLFKRPICCKQEAICGADDFLRIVCHGSLSKWLTMTLSGTQQAPRSGLLLLRVRDEQPVSPCAHWTSPDCKPSKVFAGLRGPFHRLCSRGLYGLHGAQLQELRPDLPHMLDK